MCIHRLNFWNNCYSFRFKQTTGCSNNLRFRIKQTTGCSHNLSLIPASQDPLPLIYKSQPHGHYLKHTRTICIDFWFRNCHLSAPKMALNFWSFILPLLLVTLSSMTSDKSVAEARNLPGLTLQLSKVHRLSKLEVPSVLPTLPLPISLPQPGLPAVPIPEVPGVPGIPKVPEVPGIPQVPQL